MMSSMNADPNKIIVQVELAFSKCIALIKIVIWCTVFSGLQLYWNWMRILVIYTYMNMNFYRGLVKLADFLNYQTMKIIDLNFKMFNFY